MSEFYLHVGLHKTGTKFFQHRFFNRLPASEFVYNPEKITQLVCDLVKADDADLAQVLSHLSDERSNLERQHPDRKIVISREAMSGDLFSFYEEHQEIHKRLKLAFPDARIIFFIRNQIDWMISCYRESVHEHHYQKIGQFLGESTSNGQFLSTKYKKFNLPAIISSIREKYSPQNITFIFFENFKKDKKCVIKEVSDILGFEGKVEESATNRILNRGYSALGITLSIWRYKVLRFLRLDKFFVHRPIFFMGPNGIPAGFEHLSVLPKDKYWNERFYRDNEEVRAIGYPDELNFKDKMRLFFSWRKFIKNFLDRYVYFDWDMLTREKRREMQDFFRDQNSSLSDAVHISENEIPKEYHY